ncbi:MAG TPA: DsrE family protein [Chitinophagales bacterium]|jgi:intracellular sulfur oxidation DsrE/DsrF family protein|nr:DsrE family protein [Chitinophagales bacterium]HPH88923.1 DsrE family protein [Chitinophagales bacterium]
MYKIVSTVLMAFILLSVVAKEGKNKSKNNVHKIIFQLTTNDTMAHKALMKQLNNITTVAPTTKIEIVCHGPGLEMLITEKSIVHQKIKQLSAIGVSFIACEFSMKERNVPQDKIIPEAGYVKAGIIEIVTKQEQGWSYIKSGF